MVSSVVSADEDAALAAIQQRLSSSEVRHGAFHQTKQIAAFDRTLESSGQFVYQPDVGVIWLTEEPFVTKQCWTAGAANTTSAGYWVQALFNGDFTVLKQYFAITSELHDATWRVELRPSNEVVAAVLSSISVVGSEHIESIRYEEVGGHRTDIQLTTRHESSSVDWAACQ